MLWQRVYDGTTICNIELDKKVVVDVLRPAADRW
jgi:hypothetical protein